MGSFFFVSGLQSRLPSQFFFEKTRKQQTRPVRFSGLGSAVILGIFWEKNMTMFFFYSNDDTLLYFGLIRVFSLIKLISEVSVQQSEQRV